MIFDEVAHFFPIFQDAAGAAKTNGTKSNPSISIQNYYATQFHTSKLTLSFRNPHHFATIKSKPFQIEKVVR